MDWPVLNRCMTLSEIIGSICHQIVISLQRDIHHICRYFRPTMFSKSAARCGWSWVLCADREPIRQPSRWPGR